MTTRPFSRCRRLEFILELLNRIHCRRRLTGRRTDHLLGRCRRLSAAFLAARATELSTPL